MEEPLPYNPGTSAKSTSPTGPAFKMSLMIAGTMIIYTLFLFILGQSLNKGLGPVNYLFFIAGLILGGINFRDKQMGGYITYGKAFTQAFLTALYACLIYGVFNYIFFKFIAHDLIGIMLQQAEEELSKRSLTEEQMTQMSHLYHKIMVPGVLAIGSLVFNLFIGTIIALISAAITRKDPPPGFNTTPPAV